MKKIIISILATAFLLSLSGCSSDCSGSNPRCADKVPTGTTCQAVFTSWIYDAKKKKCDFKSYSGCNSVGFETKEECETCKCK